MARRTFPLVDVDRGLFVREAQLGPNDVGGAARSWSVRKRTLEGGLRDGVEVVEAACGPLRATLVPTRGMAIWKAWWNELEIGWQAPVRGPVHPKFVRLSEPSGFGWLDGFDELLCRCGLESNGAPEWDGAGRLRWPLHGRIGNLPAHELSVTVDGDRGEIEVRGVVDETRLFGRKLRLVSTTTLRAGEPRISVHDEVINLSGEPGELQLLYHVNFGAPIVAAGSRVRLAADQVSPRDARAERRVDEWDRIGEPEARRPEEVFYAQPSAGADGLARALICGPGDAFGAGVAWEREGLPCFSLWKNPQLPVDGHVVGLEPATNYPNPRSFEQARGRVAAIAPGERRRFALDLEIHPDRAALARAIGAIEQAQASTPMLVQRRSDTRFAPI